MNDILSEEAESTWSQTADNLLRHFHDASDDKCLLWVDPAQFDPFTDDALVRDTHVRIPIRHPRFDIQRGPYLVPLNLRETAAINVLEQSIERAWRAWTVESLSAFCGQPVAGWVATQSSAQSLAAYWASYCYIHRRQNLTKLLRFHDPGVREWLWPILSEGQRHTLLGPAKSIFSTGRRHLLQCHTRSSSHHPSHMQPSLVLEEPQWAQVEDYAPVHAAWVTCLNDSTWDSSKISEQSIFKALTSATSYGLNDPCDRELFALHALRVGFDFHSKEEMLPVWERTANGDYYGNAIEDVFACPADHFHLYFKSR